MRGEDKFKVTHTGGFGIGSAHILSTRSCVEPAKAPEPGQSTFSMSPWGTPILALNYTVAVDALPVVSLKQTTETVSLTKPIAYTISAPDTVYTYKIAAKDASQDCVAVDSVLNCPIDKLSLTQGETYELTLQRQFDTSAPSPLVEHIVSVIPAVTITKSSVEPDATLYDTRSDIQFETNKKPTSITAKLAKNGDAKQDIPIETTTTDNSFSVVFKEKLPRESSYTLTVSSAEAEDGSTLSTPYILNFNTSGGPKVRSSNMPAVSAEPSATFTITFDQPFEESVDIGAFVEVQGAGATVRRQGNQEILVSLQSAALCSVVTIKINKGIQSGSNELKSTEEWTNSSRIRCGYSSVIGYSVQGRAIVAYTFGSGGTKILFTGGIHGSEQSSYSTMQGWVNYLQSNGYKIPGNKQVVVVPNTNPDGIARGSRYNVNNVNLGRNFPTANWKSDAETPNGYEEKVGGESPGSEPETKALMSLTGQLRPRLEVSFHAQGRLVGANKVGDSTAIGNRYASTVGYATMYDNAEEVMGGYAITGEYEEWMGEAYGTPAILIELPSHYGNYLNSQLTALWLMVNV